MESLEEIVGHENREQVPRDIVNSAVGDALAKYFEENPKTAKILVRKGVLAAEAREAARKAKDMLRKRKSVLGGGGLPGKLRDCISKEMAAPGRTENFSSGSGP
ncbi:MAG: hypothetical protein R6X10_06110, partial [Desulfobacterales bacterium]